MLSSWIALPADGIENFKNMEFLSKAVVSVLVSRVAPLPINTLERSMNVHNLVRRGKNLGPDCAQEMSPDVN